MENKSYGKRPLWQWLLLYAVIAVVVYGAFYYFVLAKKGGYNTTPNPYSNQQNVSPTSNPSTSSSSEVLTTKTDPSSGDYLADAKGMTLYIYDKDTKGVTNCYGGCATAWPPYLEGTNAPAEMPANVTTVKRTDGSMQYAYKGMPLYYYATDQNPGDITGDGVGGVWHLVKP